MNPFQVVILSALFLRWFINATAYALNIRSFSPDVPSPFLGLIDTQLYAKAQRYMKNRSWFAIITSGIVLAAQTGIICGGAFDLLDRWIRGWGMGDIGTGLFFGLTLFVFYRVFNIPMDLYETFVLEERFGFNRTTPKTYWSDWFKSLLIGILFGGGLWLFVLALFEQNGFSFWIYGWLGVSLYQVIVMFIAPVLLLPLFYQLKPLADGDLKDAVEDYSRRRGFKAGGIFVMDGSTRSTRTNAFFTGFGRYRRIVFFDTLMNAHPKDEILAVLAHEMGHSKLNHVPKTMLFFTAVSGIWFWGLALFAHHPGLFAAFGVEDISIYAGIIFYGYLSIPFLFAGSMAGNILSRAYEFEADAYAARTHSKESMAASLKRIAKDNLVSLSPHPFKVWLMDSHPPILQRLKKIETL